MFRRPKKATVSAFKVNYKVCKRLVRTEVSSRFIKQYVFNGLSINSVSEL